MRTLAHISFALLYSNAVFPQSTEATARFGIADVHARAPNSILSMRTGFAHGRYELRNATMVDLIQTAWGVDADKVVGGPGWLEIDRFDVVGTAPADSTPDTLETMLRGLLEERFHLVAHKDTKDLPAYAMTVGKKSLLEQADGSGETGCKLQPGKNPASPRPVPGEPVLFACRNTTMADLAQALPNLRGASSYLFNYAVVDRTGTKAAWNFSVKWSQLVNGSAGPAADAITLFEAFEKQLGLKLELARVPTPVVVVDSVNRRPTANPPGVTEKLPPPPTEFEVAEVKPDDPDNAARGSNVAIRPGGRVIVNMTLKGLIEEAWGELNSDLIVGGPKFLDTARFVVVAKAPTADMTDGPAVWNGLDIDSMRMMLRRLVVDRFRLATHEEERLVSGYALVASRPKLRAAGPANHPGCKEGPGPDGKDPRTTNFMASRLVTCWNMTLGEFAAELTKFGWGYLHPSPAVVDATGMNGRYDMTLNFSPYRAVQNSGGPSAGGDAAASEPNGTISLFEALDHQLGLKLESRKVTAPVLVIDHVDEMPREN